MLQRVLGKVAIAQQQFDLLGGKVFVKGAQPVLEPGGIELALRAGDAPKNISAYERARRARVREECVDFGCGRMRFCALTE